MTRLALALLAVLATASPGRSFGPSPEPSVEPSPEPRAELSAEPSVEPRPGPRAELRAEPSSGKIADLAWLEGHWAGADGPLQMEEIWTSAAGDALVGLHKDVATRAGAARMVSFEFLRIEAGADGIAYIAQPGGQPPTRFALAEIGARRVVFANPAHDFPQRILYWLDDAGALHARVEGPKGGKTVGQEWTWTKRAGR